MSEFDEETDEEPEVEEVDEVEELDDEERAFQRAQGDAEFEQDEAENE